jgi:hypothetical protein
MKTAAIAPTGRGYSTRNACDFQVDRTLPEEVEALWVGGTKEVLDRQFECKRAPAFQPAAVFVVPRWTVAVSFQGNPAETSVVTSMIQGCCISGFSPTESLGVSTMAIAR